MTYTVVFRPQAEKEARAAQRWYEEQQPGLGARFAGAIDKAIQRVVSNPAAFLWFTVKSVARSYAGFLSESIFESTLRISSYLL